jgi:hypothetical protein
LDSRFGNFHFLLGKREAPADYLDPRKAAAERPVAEVADYFARCCRHSVEDTPGTEAHTAAVEELRWVEQYQFVAAADREEVQTVSPEREPNLAQPEVLEEPFDVEHRVALRLDGTLSLVALSHLR